MAAAWCGRVRFVFSGGSRRNRVRIRSEQRRGGTVADSAEASAPVIDALKSRLFSSAIPSVRPSEITAATNKNFSDGLTPYFTPQVGSGKTGILDFLPPNSFSDGLFR
jgi:hypothetical protein